MNGALELTIFIASSLLFATVALTWRASTRRRVSAAATDSVSTLPPLLSQWRRSLLAAWTEMKTDELKLMQVAVAVAAVFITSSVGYLYVGELWVQGWQLWTWLVCIVVLAATLVPWASLPTISLPNWRWLVVLSVLALLLRALSLESVPGLLHVDEIGSADFPMLHVFPDGRPTINPFITGNASQPVLFQYLMRLSIAVAGYSITGIRISSAIAGVLAVMATYFAVAVFQDRRTALISAALMATYHYHIHWSRIALNNIWDTLWVPLWLAAFAWGWRKQWSGGAALAGLAVGLSQYFYAGSKLGLLLLLYVIVVLYRQDQDRRRLIIHVGKFLFAAWAVAAPIIVFALVKPEAYFLRTSVVLGWQEHAIVSAIGEYDLWRYFWHQVWRSLGAFTSVSEITGFYGPGVPFLIGLAAPLFGVGFFWSAWRRRFLPVLWICLTALLAGMMLGGTPSSSHYAVSIPAICWLTAVPISWLWERGRRPLALFVLAAVMSTDLAFYFGYYAAMAPRDLIHPLPPLP